MLTQLKSQVLPKLGEGYLGKQIDRAIEAIAHDLNDRPDDPKARTLTLKIEFKPQGEGLVKVSPQVSLKLPNYVPPSSSVSVTPDGKEILFRTDSMRVNQPTFPIPDTEEPRDGAE